MKTHSQSALTSLGATTALLWALTMPGIGAQRGQPTAAQHADWPTFGFDVTRSGVSTATSGITAANVASLQRQQLTLDGFVDASAIYLHGVTVGGRAHDTIFVTNSYGKTIAVDANDGSVLWQFTPDGYQALVGSRQISNSTPTADPARDFIYAASADGKIEKLAVADGRMVWATSITKLPLREKMDSPLTFFRGRVIAVTGGYIGDAPPYQGHVAILDAASGQLLHVWNSLCSDKLELLDPPGCAAQKSAIWGRAGAVINPANGDIYISTGNGPWDGKTSWGDAVLRLNADATQLLGNYTPANTAELESRDLDIGSTSPALLGGGFIAQGGKDGTIKLLSDQMMQGTTPHKGGELQTIPTPSGGRMFTAPAVLHQGAATWMFVADGGGTAAWTFANGQMTANWHNTTPGTSPVVAGGLLYVYDPAGSLHVYEPQTGKVLASLDCGPGHWNSPIVVDGKVILPEGGARRGGGGAAPLNVWRLRR